MGLRLEWLRQRVLSATDEAVRVAMIDKAAAYIRKLEVAGKVTAAEAAELRCDWVHAVARDSVARLFRQRDALGVARLTQFLRHRPRADAA